MIRLRSHRLVICFFTLITLGCGLVNLYSVMGGPGLPERLGVLAQFFPVEFRHFSRFVALFTGFALVVAAINIFKRKKRAWSVVVLLALISIGANLSKGLDYEEASLSLALVVGLYLARRHFTVLSSPPEWETGILRLVVSMVLVVGYGVAGFWFLDETAFHVNFNWHDAIHQTFLFLTASGDPALVPHTRYAQWFLDSLVVIGVMGVVYACFSLFRPALYRLRTLPREHEHARTLVGQHGRSALDFFKSWPDKSLFFSPSQSSFLAYRVGKGMAVVLGDPIGPEEEMEPLIREFAEFCREQDWALAFHQTQPTFLPLYRKLGYRRIKIGDDAIVDLTTFSLEGRDMKKIRHYCNKLEKEGIHTVYMDPPIPQEMLEQIREVSDDWLTIPGRRERRFTLGKFEAEYVRHTPVMVAADSAGLVLAFVNLIPSFAHGEATIDLMRYHTGAPNAVMELLMVRLLAHCREQGFTRFNLGMAPLAGFQEHERASVEERAIHFFLQNLNFLFSFSGMRQYKAKFATIWEPRYTIYRNPLDLPRLALALPAVCEIRDESHE